MGLFVATCPIYSITLQDRILRDTYCSPGIKPIFTSCYSARRAESVGLSIMEAIEE